jgi:BASS family bile acid:Na+ symporter
VAGYGAQDTTRVSHSHQWLGLVLQLSIMLTVLGLGLTATVQDATFLLRRPALLGRAVFSMNVVMPVVVALIASRFELPLEIKVALIALAVSPVPPILHKRQITAGGSREYAVGLLVAMSLLAIILVPLTVAILNQIFGRAASIGPLAVAKIMLTSVLVPLIAGVLLRRSFPMTEKASAAVLVVAGTLLLVGVALLVYGLWPVVRGFIGNGVVLTLALIATLGLLVGHLLGGPRASDRTALALATAVRHPALALAIATSGKVIEPKSELGAILLYLIVATVISLPYQMWRSRPGNALALKAGIQS